MVLLAAKRFSRQLARLHTTARISSTTNLEVRCALSWFLLLLQGLSPHHLKARDAGACDSHWWARLQVATCGIHMYVCLAITPAWVGLTCTSHILSYTRKLSSAS